MLLTIVQWHADCIDVGAFKVVVEWQTLIRKVLTAVYSVSSTHVFGSRNLHFSCKLLRAYDSFG